MTPADLVPHRGRMLLLDDILSFDAAAGALSAAFTVRADNVFYDPAAGGVPAWAAVELMAQAAAACAGAADRAAAPGAPPRPGLLLGSRNVDLPGGDFRLGARYVVTARAEFHDDVSGAFGCRIEDAEGRLMASAVLTAFRPPDFLTFLRT